MLFKNNIDDSFTKLLKCKELLFVQDIDGVCIPLVSNPLDRIIDKSYVEEVSKLGNEFSVLTCGEHEGKRGVNRIIERAFESENLPKEKGLYLPGLAACGVEYQDRFGNVETLGLNQKERLFLSKIPLKIKDLLNIELLRNFPNIEKGKIENEVEIAVCDTRYSPAINLNSLFNMVGSELESRKRLQLIMKNVMDEVINYSVVSGLKNSFYLHISPNLGTHDKSEIIKYATPEDIGTTDIQLIIKGALKQAGLIVLINKYVFTRTGKYPFGEDFSVRDAPETIQKLIDLCKTNVPDHQMPTLIGVGDTITSTKDQHSQQWLRGGSDRGFLTLIQKLGEAYNKENQIIFVDSSYGEVYRPSTIDGNFDGITDERDNLKFTIVMNRGPEQYKSWIKEFCKRRSRNLDTYNT